MEILNDKEARNYKGGFKLTKAAIALITGTAAFLLGIIDGLCNPYRGGQRWF